MEEGGGGASAGGVEDVELDPGEGAPGCTGPGPGDGSDVGGPTCPGGG